MLNLRLIKFCLFYPIIHVCIFLFNLLKGFLDFIFLSLCYHISNFLFFDCSPFCSILFMFQDGISLPSSPRLSMIVSLKFLLLFAPSLFLSSLFLLLWPLLRVGGFPQMSRDGSLVWGWTPLHGGILLVPGEHFPWRKMWASLGVGHTRLKTQLHTFLL